MTRSIATLPPLLFFGGKGGVGKTTLAAATALGFARSGERVLLLSVDPAHSLGDLLEAELDDQPRRILDGLFARELDPERARQQYLERVRENIRAFSPPELVSEAERQVVLAGRHPGAAESALFEALCQVVVEQREWDRVIVDTAPTGHTLYLLALPEQMQSWTEALLLRQQESATRDGPAPAADQRWQRARHVLDKRRELFSLARKRLTDPAQAGFCLVLNTDRLSRRESARARKQIEDAGVRIPLVLINRVEPEDEPLLAELRGEYTDLPLLELQRIRPAPVGIAGLEALAARLMLSFQAERSSAGTV